MKLIHGIRDFGYGKFMLAEYDKEYLGKDVSIPYFEFDMSKFEYGIGKLGIIMLNVVGGSFVKTETFDNTTSIINNPKLAYELDILLKRSKIESMVSLFEFVLTIHNILVKYYHPPTMK